MSAGSAPGEPHRPRLPWRAIGAAVLRESRASWGRLAFFAGCLAIGVAAVVGVASLVAAMDASLRASSRDLLGADLSVSARRPLPDELRAALAGVPHDRVDVRELAAMLSTEEPSAVQGARVPMDAADGGDGAGSEARPGASRLVELKVVEGDYPFYGELVLAPQLTVRDLGAEGAFLASELLATLGLAVGDTLRIGGAPFRVLAEVLDEPDRLDFQMTLGPRVFLSAAGFARTDLGAAQNRVQYRALLRLHDERGQEELEALVDELRGALPDASYLRFRTREEAQPSVERSLGQVEDYLGLVALLSLLLGGVGVSQIVRAWLAGRAQSVAVMRSLGFRAREVAAVYLGNVALLALFGSLLGGAVGALLPSLVRAFAPELFQNGVAPLWQPAAVARGVGLGVFVALFFSLPPLAAVWRVPPAAVLRAEAVPLPAPRAIRYGAPLALFVGVLASAWLQGGELGVAALFTLGLGLLAALLWGGARLAMGLSSRVPRGRLGPTLEHGLAALARPNAGTAGAIVALGLGVMVVVSMWLVESRLSAALRDALPTNAPSVFLVDVQPEQWPGVRGALEEAGARSIDSVPVVMGRLRAIDARSVDELQEEREEQEERGEGRRRSRWAFTREQRLTWMAELPEDNRLVAGALWSDPEHAEVSLEEGYAEELGVTLGDTLRLDVQGVPLELLVTSLRTVDWQSFRINFFLVVEPGVLEEAPHMRIAAARLEPDAAELALQDRLARGFPNVTLLRIRPILEKIADVLERLALGVRALGAFTILTGLVILAGSVGTTALRRSREAALLKVLGVTRGGVARLFALEYALSGLVAGTIGALGATALAWAFLRRMLELEAELPPATIPLAALATALLATASGLAASVRALRARPIETLRG